VPLQHEKRDTLSHCFCASVARLAEYLARASGFVGDEKGNRKRDSRLLSTSPFDRDVKVSNVVEHKVDEFLQAGEVHQARCWQLPEPS
jgi:hypothetical protein